jgi:hypothetical protein
MQVDLESLIDNNNPLLSKKINFQSETFSHKDTSNMLHSTIVGSRVSTSNLNYSLINQDYSLLNTSPQLQSNNHFPQINVLNKSTDEEDIDNQIEQTQKSFNIQNNIAYRNGIGREGFQLGGKLDTIQETNSEISCIKKDGVSVLNFNSSSNNINNNLISMLDERNFYSKAESLMKNININTNNNSREEESFYSPNVIMFKEIEQLFLNKSNINQSNLSLNEIKKLRIGNDNEIIGKKKCKKSNTFNMKLNDKDNSCSNIEFNIPVKRYIKKNNKC